MSAFITTVCRTVKFTYVATISSADLPTKWRAYQKSDRTANYSADDEAFVSALELSDFTA